MKKTKKKHHHKKHTSFHRAFFESLFYVAISFVVAFFLSQIGFFHQLVGSFHEYGYIGVFITGMFFVSVFTAAPATIVLLLFTETLPILPVAIVAGIGTLMGDAILLRIMSEHIEQTLSFLPKEAGIIRSVKLLRHTKYRLFLTLAGAFVVASPLPDELGLMLMGVTKVHQGATLAIAFVLNTIGIYFLLMMLR